MFLKEDRKALLEAVGFRTWKEQDQILDYKARIKLVAGGERAGKSFLGALSIINTLDEFQNGDIVWLVARDYERNRAEWNYLTDILSKLGFLVFWIFGNVFLNQKLQFNLKLFLMYLLLF